MARRNCSTHTAATYWAKYFGQSKHYGQRVDLNFLRRLCRLYRKEARLARVA